MLSILAPIIKKWVSNCRFLFAAVMRLMRAVAICRLSQSTISPDRPEEDQSTQKWCKKQSNLRLRTETHLNDEKYGCREHSGNRTAELPVNSCCKRRSNEIWDNQIFALYILMSLIWTAVILMYEIWIQLLMIYSVSLIH